MTEQIKAMIAKSFGTTVASKVFVIPDECAHGFMGMSADGKYFVFINPDITSSCLALSYDDMILYFGDYATPDILTAFACGKAVTIPHCQNVRIGYRYYNLPERTFDIMLVAEDAGYRRANNIADYNIAIDRFTKNCINASNQPVQTAQPSNRGAGNVTSSGPSMGTAATPAQNNVGAQGDMITLYGILRSFNRVEKVILYAHEDVSHGVDNDAIRIPVMDNANVLKFTKASVAQGNRVTTYVKIEGKRDALINYEVAYCKKDKTGAKSYSDNCDERHVKEFFGNIVPKEAMQMRNKSAYERA